MTTVPDTLFVSPVFTLPNGQSKFLYESQFVDTDVLPNTVFDSRIRHHKQANADATKTWVFDWRQKAPIASLRVQGMCASCCVSEENIYR